MLEIVFQSGNTRYYNPELKDPIPLRLNEIQAILYIKASKGILTTIIHKYGNSIPKQDACKEQVWYGDIAKLIIHNLFY